MKVRPSSFLSPCVFTQSLHTAAHPWTELSGDLKTKKTKKTKLKKTKVISSVGRLAEPAELFCAASAELRRRELSVRLSATSSALL